MKDVRSITASDILNIYKHNSFFTRFHTWFRFKTCPFLLIENFIPKSGIILDYGCGYGIFSHLLSITSGDRKIYGIDISYDKIKEAKKSVANNSNIIFLNSLDISDFIKRADCITMLDVLCYFSNEEQENILKFFYNNLNLGAMLVVKDIGKTPFVKFIFVYLQELMAVKLFKITKARCLNFINAKRLTEFFENIGFNVQMIDISKGYLYPHLLFVCRK